jgi:magnesium-transporting ATPase (P-type)
MPQVIEVTVYTYGELTPAAQEAARNWFRANYDFSFEADCVIDDAQEAAKRLGIEIGRQRHANRPAVYWSGFWSQGDGASFEGDYRYTKGAAKAVKEYAPNDKELARIAETLQDAQRRNFYRLTAGVSQYGRYVHETTMSVDVERNDDATVSEDDAETVTEAMRDFARWIYRRLEAAYVYATSDDAAAESLRINEYQFEADGAVA